MGFVATSLRIAAGGIAWALHFAAVYGATALACARSHAEVVPGIIAGATILAAGACVAVAIAGWRHREDFAASLSAGMGAIGFFAILLQAAPVLEVPPCA